MAFPRARHAFASFFRSPRAAVLASLLLRLIVWDLCFQFADPRRHHFQSQGREAIVLTFALVTGHGYSFPFPDFVPTGWVAPLYVWILTLGNLLFHGNGAMVENFGIFLNIIFSALTCYPIFWLGKKIGGGTTGSIATWTWVFLPVAVLMPIAFTWDQSLAALLVAVLFVCGYKLSDGGALRWWAAYGLLWGIAALNNPATMTLFPCFLLWHWLRGRGSFLATAKPLAIASLACVLVLIPWTVRNWMVLGGFTFVKSNFGVELWLGNNPQVREVWTPMRNPLVDDGELNQMVSAGELRYAHTKQREAIAFIESHPTDFLRFTFNRFLDNWTACYDSRADRYIVPLHIRLWYIAFSALFAIAVFGGTFTVLARDALRWLPLACAVIVFPVPYYVTHTSQRYRHPVDPVLTVLAVIGVSRLWELLHAHPGTAGMSAASISEATTSLPSAV